MAKRTQNEKQSPAASSLDIGMQSGVFGILRFPERRDLLARRTVQLELPEFLLCALEARVAEANQELLANEQASLNDYVESELANVITLRDIAELEHSFPGFSSAVQQWLSETRM